MAMENEIYLYGELSLVGTILGKHGACHVDMNMLINMMYEV